jgi:transposase
VSDDTGRFRGMPEPYGLSRVSANGETVIFRGPYMVGRYEDDDLALRNLVMVSLREAGHSGKEVAACFSLSEEYVAILRARAKREGSAGLVRQLGRPRKLSEPRARRARAWAAQGVTNAEIARRLSVHAGTIGRLLGRRQAEETTAQKLDLDGEEAFVESGDTAGSECEEEASEPAGSDHSETEAETDQERPAGLRRLENEDRHSRYAGAMLLHAFLSRFGANDVLSFLPARAARRYDAASLLVCSSFSFALGASSLEGTKHLRSTGAGALVGLESFPHLRSLRPALRSLAELCDPLSLQRSFAQAMLRADDVAPELFYVDDHFVTYWGKHPVAKGYNIRRHLAEPGRDDTFVVDDTWRAICFSSGEARGLSVSMPEVLDQLAEITDGRPVMVGFDRGGSYPKVFAALAARGMEWVTWRRAPLATPTVQPRRSWTERDAKRHYLRIADEQVTLSGYDASPVRQLSAYENGKVAFQVLTSNTSFRPAPLVAKLRGRWCIENFNKYLEDHHGIHWLCSYEMDTEPDTAMVANPARKTARSERTTAKTAVSEAERSLGQAIDASYDSVDERIAVIGARRDDVAIAKDALADVSAALKGIPAKRPANQLDPGAMRAKPRLPARALQMVCRLLAYNAELDLARRLNAYLDDPDEYRAITRNLLHLDGTITYRPHAIGVHLDRPDAPRVARALQQLVDELNAGPVVQLAGDHRPITYQVAGDCCATS